MCKHMKVYNDDIILTSFPAKYPWICNKCGEKGYDMNHNDSDLKRLRKMINIKEFN